MEWNELNDKIKLEVNLLFEQMLSFASVSKLENIILKEFFLSKFKSE